MVTEKLSRTFSEAAHSSAQARRAVRFAVVLVTSSELVKLRMLVGTEPQQDYFFFLYMTYVGLQVRSIA